MCNDSLSRFAIVGRRTLALVMLAFFPSLLSCSDDARLPEGRRNERGQTTPREPTDQDSPAGVLKKYHFAILNKDRSKFVECYRIQRKSDEYLDAILGSLAAQSRFVAAIEKAYGQDGLADFQDVTTAKAGMYIVCPPPPNSRWWEAETANIRVNVDEAKYIDPYSHREQRMTRSGNVWRINLELPEPDSIASATDYHKMLAEILSACMPDVGKPGVTIDVIRLKLGKLEKEGTNSIEARRTR
jgi:hypothetical protein